MIICQIKHLKKSQKTFILMTDIKLIQSLERLEITINGLVHLSLPNRVLNRLIYHSYIEDTISKKMYYVDLYHEGTKIQLEYDTKEKWELILKLLNDAI